MKLQTRYVRSGNANIAYQIVGEGDYDVVFVPCWISHLERLWREPRFARFVERLATFGRVILFDKRGTGMSDPAPATSYPSLDERMEDLASVLDAVGSRRAILVGSAIGGRLSALFAAAHPERVAALITIGSSARGSWAPDYPWAPAPEEHDRHFAKLLREWGGPVEIEAYAPSLADDPVFRQWWAECLRSGASPTAAVAAARLNAETDIRAVLPQIKSPSLILNRTGDRVFLADAGRDLAERIPGARFVELSGSDHLAFVGDQDELFAAIDTFLASALGTKATERPERILATVLVAAGLGAERSIGEDVSRFHGRMLETTPEGVVAVFDGPARAVRCAEAIVEHAHRRGLRSQIALHTGMVDITGGAANGPAAQLARRIAVLARPGEVLVSGTVVGLVAGSGLSFVSAGDREVGGLPADCQLFRLGSTPQPLQPAKVTAFPTAHSLATPIAPLSPREQEVTALVARGQSNREIGLDLTISAATVERHVANIMTKLGVRSRTHIAAWATEQQRSGRPAIAPAITIPRAPLPTVAFAAD